MDSEIENATNNVVVGDEEGEVKKVRSILIKNVKGKLEAIKRVNSFTTFFTSVIVLGFTFNVISFRSLSNKKECNVGRGFASATLLIQLVCFGLFASSTAAINSLRSILEEMKEIGDEEQQSEVEAKFSQLRAWAVRRRLWTILVGSVVGGAFLNLSLVFSYEMKTGKLDCQHLLITFVISWVCFIVMFSFIDVAGRLYTAFSD